MMRSTPVRAASNSPALRDRLPCEPSFSDVSQHDAAVRKLIGTDLEHLPMYDDPAVAVHTEDIDACPLLVAGPLRPRFALLTR